METQRISEKSGLIGKLADFGRKAVRAAVIGSALYGGMNSQVKAETMTYSDSPVTQASINANEYFQYGVSSSDPDVGGFSVMAFDAAYQDNPVVELGANEGDLRVDTSIYPIDKFWVTYLTLENESGEVEKIWSNYTPSLQVGDKLTGKVSIENRVGSSIYAPISLDVMNLDLSGNQNGVNDILISYEGDWNLDGNKDIVGSILASDAIENHDGNIASWQQFCGLDFDHRAGQSFMTVTFEAVGNVPEASTVGLLASAGIVGAGVATLRRKKKGSK